MLCGGSVTLWCQSVRGVSRFVVSVSVCGVSLWCQCQFVVPMSICGFCQFALSVTVRSAFESAVHVLALCFRLTAHKLLMIGYVSAKASLLFAAHCDLSVPVGLLRSKDTTMQQHVATASQQSDMSRPTSCTYEGTQHCC